MKRLCGIHFWDRNLQETRCLLKGGHIQFYYHLLDRELKMNQGRSGFHQLELGKIIADQSGG